MRRFVFLLVFVVFFISCSQQSKVVVEVPVETSVSLSAADELRSLLAVRPDAYTVEYDLSVSGPQDASGSLVVAVQGLLEGGYQKYVTRSTIGGKFFAVFFLDGRGVRCVKDGVWKCADVPFPSLLPGSQSDVELNPEMYDVGRVGKRDVFGHEVECFSMVFEGVLTEYCYSSDGIPLFIKTTSGEVVSELSAKSVKRSVDDELFVLPVPALPLPVTLPQTPVGVPVEPVLVEVPEIIIE